MSATIPELDLQGCIVNTAKHEAITISFTGFDDLNQFIEENPSEYDGFSFEGAKVAYKLVPKGTPIDEDEDGSDYCPTLFDWAPLGSEEIGLIVEDYHDAVDSETMSPYGIPCMLRVFFENQDSKLLMEKDFETFDELNSYIEANPYINVITCVAETFADLGVVELINGKPSRYPIALTDDDGWGMGWSPLELPERKEMMRRYRSAYKARQQYALSLLSERDQEDLASEEPSKKASLLLSIVHNLIRKHYAVSYAQSNALIGTWENDSAPLGLYTEIVFADRHDFPIPVPDEICYSQAHCRITVLPGTDPTGEYKELVMKFDEEHRGKPQDEYSRAFQAFSEANSGLWALRALLEWSEALPERP